MNHGSISRLLIMAVMHFLIMFGLMYVMVDNLNNVFLSLNQLYMAAIMTAPMLVLEILLMGSMYKNKKTLNVILGASILIFVIFFLFIRQQIGISDKEFLRSMIPHHAGAILMCKKANLHDPEIKKLCQSIIVSQQTEIDQMKRKLLDF